MKIVQSYWSKPSLKKKNLNETDRNQGGWLDRKYNYFSWALSCLKFKEFYDKVELYTDHQGAEFLIEKLQLPYSDVHIVLDELNHYPHDLWAVGKLYTYGLQTEPFLHVDGDIFVWSRFDEHLLSKELIAQNDEQGFHYYQSVYQDILSNFSFVPELLQAYYNEKKSFSGVNAGILGANDIAFIQKYVSFAFHLINKNIDQLSKINIGLFNNFFEQCLFRTLAELEGIDIAYLLDKVNDRFDHLVDFTGAPINTQYIHAVGVYKKREETGILLEHKLKEEFPNYYFKIMELLTCNLV